MDAKLYGSDGKAKGNATLPDSLFGQQVHEHLLWLSAKRHLADQRQGTAKVKAKGEVSGGGKKPFRQKGTGRARQGSNTSPLMPGGGRAFGPKARRRQALASALSHKASENAVTVLESIKLEAPKTKEMAATLKALGCEGK